MKWGLIFCASLLLNAATHEFSGSYSQSFTLEAGKAVEVAVGLADALKAAA